MPEVSKLDRVQAERLCRACEQFLTAIADYAGECRLADQIDPLPELPPGPRVRIGLYLVAFDWESGARLAACLTRLYANGRIIIANPVVPFSWRREGKTEAERQWHRQWLRSSVEMLKAVRWVVRMVELRDPMPLKALVPGHRAAEIDRTPSDTGAFGRKPADRFNPHTPWPREIAEQFDRAVDVARWIHFAALAPEQAIRSMVERSPSIHRNSLILLQVLGSAEGGKAMMRADVAAASEDRGGLKGEKAVGQWLQKLVGDELVSKPYGDRGGYAITEIGRDRLVNVRQITD